MTWIVWTKSDLRKSSRTISDQLFESDVLLWHHRELLCDKLHLLGHAPSIMPLRRYLRRTSEAERQF